MLIRYIFVFLLVLLSVGSAQAERRVALVVGNSAYQKVAPLTNPANDANAVAGMLRAAGFDQVDTRMNVSVNELRRVLRDFGDRARDADVVVVYYAGHGIELDGTNYLIPIDAALERDVDVLDETISLDRVLFAVEPARQLRLIILDACRDNPFTRTMKRTLAGRSVGRGLAKIEPTSPNTMIAFAAKAGSTASDGSGQNSPFAASLIEHLPKPGLDLRRAFGFVRDDVLKTTGNKQEPYVYGSLGGNDVPLVAAKPVVVAPTVPQADPQATVRRDFELAMQNGSKEVWQAFLQTYPEGFYANMAKVQLKKAEAEEARAAAAEKARLAEQEKARLATESAARAEQEKAAALARAAEQARLAAEKAKQLEQDKAAAAELKRKEAEAAAAKALAEKQAAEKALADRLAAEKAAKEEKQAAADKETKVAALSPPAESQPPSPKDLARSVQSELRRVGCFSGNADSDWTSAAQRALGLFNRHAGTKLDVKAVSTDALDAVRAKPGRVCPLVCERGFRADGDRCTRIVCKAGYQVNADNECEKVEKKPVATRDDAGRPGEDPKKQDAERKRTESAPAKPQTSGQIFCTNLGCRPVRPGCHIEPISQTALAKGAMPGGSVVEVCN